MPCSPGFFDYAPCGLGTLTLRQVTKWLVLPVSLFCLLYILSHLGALKASFANTRQSFNFVKLARVMPERKRLLTYLEEYHRLNMRLETCPTFCMSSSASVPMKMNATDPLELRPPVPLITARPSFHSNTTWSGLYPGGLWSPLSVGNSNCTQQSGLAVVIPFRNRHRQLNTMLPILHQGLRRQGVIPYACPRDPNEPPLHMSANVSQFGWKLLYRGLVGGVLRISTAQFVRVNGYSNMYWGWGGEDDDLHTRLVTTEIGFKRLPGDVGVYYSLPHPLAQRHLKKTLRDSILLNTSHARFKHDGLLQLRYQLTKVTPMPALTWLVVNLKYMDNDDFIV
ncbi:unnamed protein product [Protopolystoma xenopodis]|uniref:Beta-1,4-galactosyltransferase n=1 Tax=Protopolystoma xenopodis TaxID=117903 RepID=A0A448XLD7_9PLAT|nr:unnamed protein product [Protopolystoma xenopodis]